MIVKRRARLSRIRNIWFRHVKLLRVSTLLLITVCSISFLGPKKPEKLLWLTPRSGGFNNQLITIYEAINCARIHKRKVVLPLIYENVRADTSSKGFGPYPFEDYFDISAFKKLIPVTTPVELDVHGLPCKTIYFSTSKHFKANERRIPRLLKQQYVKRYDVNLQFLPSFSYPVDYNCVDDSMCRLEDKASFGKYSSYEESGQGYNIRRSFVFKEIRAAFKPGPTVTSIAKLVLDSVDMPYNAVHLRRGDFRSKCSEMSAICARFGNESIVQSREAILQRVRQFRQPLLPLFVTTTHADECRELLHDSGIRSFFLEDFVLPPQFELAKNRTDILSFAAQLIASKAEQFVANRFSSFSTEINYMRYLQRPSDEVLFF